MFLDLGNVIGRAGDRYNVFFVQLLHVHFSRDFDQTVTETLSSSALVHPCL